MIIHRFDWRNAGGNHRRSLLLTNIFLDLYVQVTKKRVHTAGRLISSVVGIWEVDTQGIARTVLCGWFF